MFAIILFYIFCFNLASTAAASKIVLYKNIVCTCCPKVCCFRKTDVIFLSRSLLTLDVLRREISVGRRLGKNGILKFSFSRCIKVSACIHWRDSLYTATVILETILLHYLCMYASVSLLHLSLSL